MYAHIKAMIRFQNRLHLSLCIGDAFCEKFILNSRAKTFIQHIDLTLNRNRRVLADISLHGVTVHEKHHGFSRSLYFICLVNRHIAPVQIMDTGLTIDDALDKLATIEINRLTGNCI